MSFSNSSIKLYETCPFKYKLQRIDGFQEPTGTAAERGKMIHAELEAALIALPVYSEVTEYWEPLQHALPRHMKVAIV
jgi:hypothetical protein